MSESFLSIKASDKKSDRLLPRIVPDGGRHCLEVLRLTSLIWMTGFTAAPGHHDYGDHLEGLVLLTRGHQNQKLVR